MLFSNSDDYPATWGILNNVSNPTSYYGYSALDLDGYPDAEKVWSTMVDLANQISVYNIDYDLLDQNSNSTIATILSAVGMLIPSITVQNGSQYTYPASDHLLNYDWLYGKIYSYEINGSDDANDILWALDGQGDGIAVLGSVGDTVFGLGGDDEIHGGSMSNVLVGGDGVDRIYSYSVSGFTDIITGGNLPSGFSSAAEISKTYFQTFRREFNDGSQDFIKGGSGDDIILIESDAQTSGGFYDTTPPSDLRQVLDKLDYVDGSDQDYLAHVQYDDSGVNPLYFSFTQDSVAAALAGGNQIIGTSEFFYQGNWEQLGDVVGFRVDDVNGVGAVMLLGSWAASWGQEFYAGVTTTRDLSQSGGQWTVLGGDPTGTPNLQAESVSELALAATGVDSLYGGNADDGIYAYGGNDTIVLGAYVGGADYVDGGAGSDTVDYTGTSSKLVISIADTSNGTVTGLGAANNDVLANIENISTGSGADDVTGSSAANTISTDGGADTIHGGDGNDDIYAGGGADKMFGEAGSDRYYVDNAGDIVTEVSGQGTDTVYASVTYTLTANVENLVLQDGAINGTGNAFANTITGNALANTLDGGAGGDLLIGGDGNDVYIIDNVEDTIREFAGEGSDTVMSSTINVSIASLTYVQHATLTGASALNVTGNGSSNILTGNAAANTLDGGGGADTLTGGDGNDVYIIDNVEDTIKEFAGEGSDTVMSSTINVSIASLTYVQHATLTGSSALNATGNGSANVLTGNSAANTLDGGGGADTLTGGDGNDVYIIDNVEDTIKELAGEGNDTVMSSTVDVSIASLTYVQHATLTGSSALSATGNNSANILTGNAAANTLDGGGGADTLTGGDGNDVYIIDNTGDKIVELAGEGTDTVMSSTINVSIASLTYVQHATLTGSSALSATGNNSSNILTGNSAANTLDGGGGADTLIGGAANDVFVFAVGDDDDTINDFVSGRDIIDLSDIAEITSFADLKSQHLTDKGSYLLISSASGADTIKLVGLDAISDVKAADFMFA
jgi:Ca2+-binding RTX toxin-like protein